MTTTPFLYKSIFQSGCFCSLFISVSYGYRIKHVQFIDGNIWKELILHVVLVIRSCIIGMQQFMMVIYMCALDWSKWTAFDNDIDHWTKHCHVSSYLIKCNLGDMAAIATDGIIGDQILLLQHTRFYFSSSSIPLSLAVTIHQRICLWFNQQPSLFQWWKETAATFHYQ